MIQIRGIGAAGSAPHWQCGGHGFESRMLQFVKEAMSVRMSPLSVSGE